MEKTVSITDREIVVSQLLNVPIEETWEVWINPSHIKNWWGPNGFTNTIIKMEVVPGGSWNLVMHGPDGTDYDNESVFTEVVWHKKIEYKHLSGHEFIANIQFDDRGSQTYIDWQMLFPTEEELIRIMNLYDIKEGLQQNIQRLAAYLENKKNKNGKNNKQP